MNKSYNTEDKGKTSTESWGAGQGSALVVQEEKSIYRQRQTDRRWDPGTAASSVQEWGRVSRTFPQMALSSPESWLTVLPAFSLRHTCILQINPCLCLQKVHVDFHSSAQ